jgi:molybdopterin synthase sulfur carrier subunit
VAETAKTIFLIVSALFQEGERKVDLQNGSNMRDLLNLLCDSPKRREGIFNGGGLKPYLAILKNGKHIYHLNGLETKLDDGDTVVIFPPAGGG